MTARSARELAETSARRASCSRQPSIDETGRKPNAIKKDLNLDESGIWLAFLRVS
jgi:hypothetical protein